MGENAWINVWTDGSCVNNPGGRGGWAVVYDFMGVQKVLRGSSPASTNNQMELKAAIRGLQHLVRPCYVSLYTDSQYVQKGVTQWLDNWKKRKWKKADGKMVANIPLWQALDEQQKRHEDIIWNWIPGHKGFGLNDVADFFALQAAMEQCPEQVGIITGLEPIKHFRKIIWERV